MKNWKLAEAQKCLGEVVRHAKMCGPQRITGSDGEAVVLSAADYKRLLADAGLSESDISDRADTPEREPMGFVEFMQKSPLAEAVRAGEFPWEWDDATRRWVLPGDADVPAGEDIAGEPSMGFVEFMRTSPLAEAMAAGEISPEDWDRACRIGR
ncbi:MAG TPA: hypothetical protein VLK84_20980 [Longimicrobium sp.]|nr:hypothetical protein [Longimicrobium sp.]